MLIYAGIAAFGFLFLLIMLFAGELFGGDHEVSAHGGIDHAGEFGGPSVFSARIMASFLTAFGVGGVVARYYELSHPAAAGCGVVTGVVMSSVVYQFARILYSQQASSEVQMTSRGWMFLPCRHQKRLFNDAHGYNLYSMKARLSIPKEGRQFANSPIRECS